MLFEHWDRPEIREMWSQAARDAAIRARAGARNTFERMRPGDSHDLGHGHIVKRESEDAAYPGSFSHFHAGNHEAEGFDIPALMRHLDQWASVNEPHIKPDYKEIWKDEGSAFGT